MIGGSLSRPHERFPSTFGHYEFFAKYPYFLACAVPATFSAVAMFVTLLCLKEVRRLTSWAVHLPNRDYAQTVKSPISLRRLFTLRESKANLTFQNVAGADDLRPVAPITSGKTSSSEPLPLRALLIPRVIISAGNYALLAIVDISYRTVLPVWMSTPVTMGGLDLSPQAIGALLSIYGITNGTLQILTFSKAVEYMGAKRIYIYGIIASLPIFALMPITNLVAREEGLGVTVWSLLALQCFLSIAVNYCYGMLHPKSCSAAISLTHRRERVHLHHRVFSQQDVARIGEWPCADERIRHACHWARDGELYFLTLH